MYYLESSIGVRTFRKRENRLRNAFIVIFTIIQAVLMGIND